MIRTNSCPSNVGVPRVRSARGRITPEAATRRSALSLLVSDTLGHAQAGAPCRRRPAPSSATARRLEEQPAGDGDVAAPSQMEQSVDMCGGLSQLVHVGIAVLVGERFWMAEAKQQRWRSLLSPSWRHDHGRRDRQ